MEPKTITHRVDSSPDQDLGFRILAANTRHQPASRRIDIGGASRARQSAVNVGQLTRKERRNIPEVGALHRR